MREAVGLPIGPATVPRQPPLLNDESERDTAGRLGGGEELPHEVDLALLRDEDAPRE